MAAEPGDAAPVVPLVRAPRWDWVPRTKLFRPPPAPDTVPDEELVARTAGAVGEVPVTVVVAAAGAGKSTLASAVVERSARRSGWLRLDELDDDPTSVVELLVRALDPLVDGGLPGSRQLLDTGLPASADPRRAVGVLVNDLVVAEPPPLLLVLDDLHTVGAPGVRAVLDYLVANLPPALHLLVTARRDPPLPMPRLRARAQVHEVHDADLRISPERAEVLLNDRLGLGLTRDRVRAVVAAAGGWTTGVRLLGTAPDALDDYLDAEVLGAATPELRRFLLDTAVLDVLDPHVCAAVTGRDDAPALLADARARLGPLVLVADSSDETVDDPTGGPLLRHHDLLRAALRRRLAAEAPHRVPDLHRAAAAAITDPAARVEHLLAAGAAGEAADVVAGLAGTGFPRPTELHRLETWVRRLPPAEVAARPRLGVLAGFAAVQRGELAAATALLEPALAAATAAGPDERVTRWLAARALHVATADHARLVPVLAGLEDDPAFATLSPAARAEHHVSLAYAAAFAGDGAGCAARSRAAVTLAASGDDGVLEVLARHLGPLLIGHEGGVDLVGEHLARTEAHPHPTPLIRLGTLVQRAYLGLLTVRWDEADTAVAEAADLPERLGGLPYLRATLDWVRAAVAHARGDLALAEARCRPDTTSATDLDRDLLPLRHALLARVLRRQGRTAELDALARSTTTAGHPLARVAGAAVRAQAALAAGDPAAAAACLEQGGPVVLAPYLVPSSLDRALVLAAAARHAEAVAATREVVETARRWRMPGLLALAGDEVRPLLEEVGGRTVAAALAALDGPGGPSPVPVPGGAEVLSGREVEVLRLLADGASNRAVAARLVVSENTVKTHVRHVLTKLGAGSRGEAVALARRHHLI
ncbi:helix-turn-helix transcriptional regulator [Actinomycetospora straminea]|uniref:HTH luxR-type domain-containing protein n=1 Tax=Actinomycetospora straminea TaxID=663607 RepID=A0ABP9EKC3_9PSEU|nr:LuxR C-terminal-related transcriptional regulator [Actinomycetospora straminea]MDD7933089.1 LuxR C-terminal-related transcriptional regulator [Actinomycetospora straminea]